MSAESMKRQESLPAEDVKSVVSVCGVTVAYRSYKDRPTTLKESVINFLRKGTLRYFSTFNALDAVSFEIKKGEVFGIIGSNGAGKSTLLRTLAGVINPTEGNVNISGSVDSLIQLGTGFDSELDAVENIFLNGSLYKKKKHEIAPRVPEILKFAELEDFATTPIKYYSSGMYARLGFSVAVDRQPDILLIDEVLSVGDERFQEKCRGVFEGYVAAKKTIIMVSHSLHMLEQMASRIMVLSKGKVVFIGDPAEAIELYRSKIYETALKG